jgi:hypothetical protein
MLCRRKRAQRRANRQTGNVFPTVERENRSFEPFNAEIEAIYFINGFNFLLAHCQVGSKKDTFEKLIQKRNRRKLDVSSGFSKQRNRNTRGLVSETKNRQFLFFNQAKLQMKKLQNG